MIVCINGSRNLTDSRLLERAITQAEQEGIHISSIISGEARGVDTLAKNYAKEHGIPFVPVPRASGDEPALFICVIQQAVCTPRQRG